MLLATIGGIGWIGGALIAGSLEVAGISEHLITQVVSTEDWYPVIAAALLLLVVVFNPDGIASDVASRGRRSRPSLRRAAAAPTCRRRRHSGHRAAKTRVPPKRLELQGITVRFGNVVALDGVDLSVEPGEVVGLIGPNGAGKTTLIEAASGFVRAAGSVRLDGAALEHGSPRRRTRAGRDALVPVAGAV